jgi:selenide,water dikinase
LLPIYHPRVAKIFGRILAERNVELHCNWAVTAVEPGRLRSTDGNCIQLDEIFWVTDASAASWLGKCGLAADPNGFVKAHETLQTVSDPKIFAAGDVVSVEAHPRPKAGVFAVRQGAPLAYNLRRVLTGKRPKPFRPQRKFLSLISTGDRYAVGSRGAWVSKGAWLWRVKNAVDRRFMRKYTMLPAMVAVQVPHLAADVASADVLQELSHIAMRCGGCGAKIGSSVLERLMGKLKVVSRPEVVIGLDAPDDAAVVRPCPGKSLVQTVDYFRAIVDDPYIFGKIAANHSLGDIYAMAGEPQTALAIATVPYGIESKVEDDLFQMMSGAVAVLNDAGCALVGGHTSEGAELALGFAITGMIGESILLRKAGFCQDKP